MALGTERPVFQEVSTPEDSNFLALALYNLLRWWYHGTQRLVLCGSASHPADELLVGSSKLRLVRTHVPPPGEEACSPVQALPCQIKTHQLKPNTKQPQHSPYLKSIPTPAGMTPLPSNALAFSE